MTIRRRLALSFLAILVLFALNLVVYFWGNQKRKSTVEELRKAIDRQILIATIAQDVRDTRKRVQLLSEVLVEAATGGADPEQQAQFNGLLQSIAEKIHQLRDLSEFEARVKVSEFDQRYEELSTSWRIFYENFGVNQPKAIKELAVTADPLSVRVVDELLPQLQEGEKQRVTAASDNFYQAARLTDRITILIFIVSSVVAIVVAFRVSRYLAAGLGELKKGADLIGSGKLDHQVVIRSRDELGVLAKSFNEMALDLLFSRMNLTEANKEMERRNKELQEQRQVAESLLLNILPVQVAAELKEKGAVEPKYFEDVTILFTDFVGFTLSTEKLAAEDLVTMLHDYFTAFDQITARYYLEKLKTIGDSYMCVGGLPLGRRARRSPSHPVDAVMAAFEMIRAVQERDRPDNLARWAVRIGVHTGPVVAGVVGIQKFAFDIWGDTVNYASRMESSGSPNCINLSERTYSRVKDFFECEYRGKVLTKEKKEFDMYYVKAILPRLIDDPTQMPPPAFLRRYRSYFQKEPPAFPAFLVEQQPAPAPTPLT